MKTSGKQKDQWRAVSYVSHPHRRLLCDLTIGLLNYHISSGALEFSTRVSYCEITSHAVERLGTLLEVTHQKRSREPKCQTCGLRNLFSKFSYITKMYRIYPQFIQVPELFHYLPTDTG